MSLNEIAKIIKYATLVNEFAPVSYQFYPKTKNLWVRIERKADINQWVFPIEEPLNTEYYRRFELVCLEQIKEG